MAIFQYTGRTRSGDAASGEIEALNSSAAASMLSDQGIIPVTIQAGESRKTEKKGTGEIQLGGIKRWFERVSIDELIMFSRQMYSLTKAGVPITNAMRGLAATVRNPLLHRTLNELAAELEKGHALSGIMRKHPKLFNDLYVSIIHIGENTGQLEHAFKQMADYLELERQTTKNIKQATRYPTFVLIAIALALVVINIFVIPAFKDVFSAFGGELPWQTKALIAFSDFTVAWWHTILAITAAAAFTFARWKKSPKGRPEWDRIKLKIPLVGGIFYRATLGRFSRTFSIVLKAGIPIEQGLSVISRAVGNQYIGEKVAGMRQGIERGEGFTHTAGRTNMFSPLVMQMLSVGEETGQIDQMLEEAADFYEQEVDYDLKNLTSAIEPILIIFIAAMVLVLALGVFLPLWELSTAINR